MGNDQNPGQDRAVLSGTESLTFPRLTKLVLEVMLAQCSREGSHINTGALADAINAMHPGYQVTSLSFTTPLSKLRKCKIIRRVKIQTGTRPTHYGTVVPSFSNFYCFNKNGAAIARVLLSFIGDDERITLEEFRGIKYMASNAPDPEPTNPQAELYALASKAVVTPEEAEPYVEHKDPFFKWSKIWDRTGDGPYMLRVWIGRLRLHIFYRGDLDEDCHDHPWDFKTWPFHAYVEEVQVPHGDGFVKFWNVVPAHRWTHRKATHIHRVIGRYAGRVELTAFRNPDEVHKLMISGDEAAAFLRQHSRWKPAVEEGKIVTLVWRGRYKRMWGFWKSRAGKWCWDNYRRYIWEGGKSAPCDD